MPNLYRKSEKRSRVKNKEFKHEKTTFEIKGKEYTAYKQSYGKDTYTTIVPEIGMVVEQVVNGVKILDFDKESFDPKTHKVKGGIPILFPFGGPIDDYFIDGIKYNMKQHGFARNMEWKVKETTPLKNSSRITLFIESNEETKKQFPFDFRLEVTYILKRDGMKIIQKVYNKSGKVMPFHSGFHPYFYLPDGKVESYKDNSKEFESKDNNLTKKDLNLNKDGTHVFSRFRKKEFAFTRTDDKTISVKFSKAYKKIIGWRKGKYFCVEPWIAEPNAFRKNGGVRLRPGKTHTSSIEILLGKSSRYKGTVQSLEIFKKLRRK